MIGLKKNLDLSIDRKREMIEIHNTKLSIKKQCELLQIPRSTFYYKAQEVSEFTLKLLKLLDEQYTKTPFYGTRRMTKWLNRQGYHVNRKRIQRLMRMLGLQAVYPKPNLSKPGKGHKIYPYLLSGAVINKRNQVWSADITYIRLRNGFIYLVAIIDWFSRYVLSWEVSISLESDFCVRALENALSEYGKPIIFNTDQGVQFTCKAYTKILKENEIQISMDGKGRALDNVFVERLWRTVKYEEVYIKDYESVVEATNELCKYFDFYNNERLHQSLEYKTPKEVYIPEINEEYQIYERQRA